MRPAGEGDAGRVELTRTMPAPPERVFDAWLDADSVRRWMCPDPSVRVTDLDWVPAAGEPWWIEMDVGGERVRFSGRFLEVSPPERLAFTWVSTRTDEVETRVTVEVRAAGDGAEVRLLHEELPTPRAVEEHRYGWENILARLEGASIGA